MRLVFRKKNYVENNLKIKNMVDICLASTKILIYPLFPSLTLTR